MHILLALLLAVLPRLDAGFGHSDSLFTQSEQRPKLAVSSSLIFDPDVEAGVILVEGNFVVVNEAGDANSSVFTTFNFAVPSSVTQVRAETFAGQSLPLRIKKSDNSAFNLAVVTFAQPLKAGDGVTLKTHFEIPNNPARVQRLDPKVDAAVISFPIWGWGDPGLVTVEAIIPEGFDAVTLGTSSHLLTYQPSLSKAGVMAFVARDIAAPGEFIATFIAENNTELVSREVAYGDSTIIVQSWPSDPEWADWVELNALSSIEALEDEIGLAWRVPSLRVRESITPTLLGYGAWYESHTETIDMGELFDLSLLTHELSHGWFNHGMISQTWVVEGLAEYFQARVVSESERPLHEPDFDSSHRRPLNTWLLSLDVDEDISVVVERELYFYNYSHWVISELVSVIGHDGLQAVIVELDTKSRHVDIGRPADWRDVYLILDRHILATADSSDSGDSGDSAEVAAARARLKSIFAEHVFSPEDVTEFEKIEKGREVLTEIVDLTMVQTRQIPKMFTSSASGWLFSTESFGSD